MKLLPSRAQINGSQIEWQSKVKNSYKINLRNHKSDSSFRILKSQFPASREYHFPAEISPHTPPPPPRVQAAVKRNPRKKKGNFAKFHGIIVTRLRRNSISRNANDLCWRPGVQIYHFPSANFSNELSTQYRRKPTSGISREEERASKRGTRRDKREDARINLRYDKNFRMKRMRGKQKKFLHWAMATWPFSSSYLFCVWNASGGGPSTSFPISFSSDVYSSSSLCYFSYDNRNHYRMPASINQTRYEYLAKRGQGVQGPVTSKKGQFCRENGVGEKKWLGLPFNHQLSMKEFRIC